MLLEKAKLTLRITTDAFDGEVSDLLESAIEDLAITGSTIYVERNQNGEIVDCDPLLRRAILTYVQLHFGAPEEYDRLKRSYDEQKAQIRVNPKYYIAEA